MTGLDLVVTELENWAAETGQPLPMPAAEIARIEAAGGLVDLETGEIVNPAVNLAIRIEIAGDNADNAARQLAQAVTDGRLDLVSLQTLRDELRHVAGDWRIVTATCSAGQVHP